MGISEAEEADESVGQGSEPEDSESEGPPSSRLRCPQV